MTRLVFLVALTGVAVVAGGCDGGAGSPDAGTADGASPEAGVDAGPPPPAHAAATPLTMWVSPLIGTGGLGYGVGSAFPGAQRPFGMARPGPDTTDASGAPGFDHCAGYYYADPMIRGFGNTHLHGTGIPEYGTPGLMPTVGMSADKTRWQGYASAFSHDTEEASPGYYAVTLADTHVRVELTATDHVAFHRYTFPAGSDAVVLLDAGYFLADLTPVDASVTIDAAARTIHGFGTVRGGYSGRFGGVTVYFAARFSQPFARFGAWKAGALHDGETTESGTDAGAYVHFDTSTDTSVDVAVGLSFVDEAHAQMNLDAEATGVGFDAARTGAEQAWESALSRVSIEGRSDDGFRMFYTALYHALLMPTLASDVDQSYRGMDKAVHTADGFRYYTDLSLWDTFRTEHPLLTLLYPEYQRDMLRSLTAMARDGGYMPRWPLGDGYTDGMDGESACVVFADSWVKGITDFDLRTAYDAMRRTAMAPVPGGAPYGGRGGVSDYMAKGYVPIEASGGSASATLEYAYDDFALAELADALGESADATMFRARAGSWKNLWDADAGFLVGRHEDGTFPPNPPAFEWSDWYTEGDAWQYLWYVPQDLTGLARTLGGTDTMLGRLTMFFQHSKQEPVLLGPAHWYWHGNEPDLHVPFIFAALDHPDEGAPFIRWVLSSRYGTGPDGLAGNDDAGTLSAWYVFAASGFYPIAGEDRYLVGTPILTHVTMHLPGGDFVVDAPNASDQSLYVTGATLGGMPLTRAHFQHADITGGATLHLDMADAPAGFGEGP